MALLCVRCSRSSGSSTSSRSSERPAASVSFQDPQTGRGLRRGSPQGDRGGVAFRHDRCPSTDMTRRGTTNRNQRGNTRDRESRRRWLVETFRADVDLNERSRFHDSRISLGDGTPACRCYRCGSLLTVAMVTVDRIVPGCHGGTYRRNNIRPSCARCNSETGATIRRRA